MCRKSNRSGNVCNARLPFYFTCIIAIDIINKRLTHQITKHRKSYVVLLVE